MTGTDQAVEKALIAHLFPLIYPGHPALGTVTTAFTE